MTTDDRAEVFSDLTIPPGDTLADEIAARGMSQTELATRLGRPVQVVNEIIHGKKAITDDTALSLETVLGIPAAFWVNLEQNYRMTRARLRERERLQAEEEWLKELPVREMEKRAGLPSDRTPRRRSARYSSSSASRTCLPTGRRLMFSAFAFPRMQSCRRVPWRHGCARESLRHRKSKPARSTQPDS